jgi:hypothetical protein
MKTEQEIIDIAVFSTVYECITSILKDTLTIEQMKKMLNRLQMYVEAEERSMRR